MGSLRKSAQGLAAGIATGLCAAAGAGLALALSGLSASAAAPRAKASPAPAVRATGGSLCLSGETPIFTCPIGAKRAAICGTGDRAVYRYGVPGKVELTATSMTLAKEAFSGGGETQIAVTNGDYTYVLYDRTTRTGFGADGRNDPDSGSGLLIRRGGKTIAAKTCDDDAPIPSRAEHFIAAGGTLVQH